MIKNELLRSWINGEKQSTIVTAKEQNPIILL